MIGLDHYLVLAAALFCIGFVGAVVKRNAIAVLMGIELMLNAVNLNLVAFDRFGPHGAPLGQSFAVFIIAVAAAEVAVALAIILTLYRRRSNTRVDDLDMLKW
ncbi:MAG TPA: NADH-quinone oxidoreductase subunit NuoK [Rectinemataceae bacterium]|nr:NADH-quinone oxidoreductase subunit NuoK [Rectinemataceae bacterium]